MAYNQISIFLLDKSYDLIFDIEKKFLSFFLKKYQENCDIFEIQHFLD